jgi:tripartite-type tricarboxylate transporter receptor subunit TctC
MLKEFGHVALKLFAVAGAVFVCGPASAQSGKPLTILIGYTPGANYDLQARVLAKHLGKYLSGNPTVIPQNMAGAGSLRVANYLYNVAPKDGSAIGVFGRGIATQPLLDEQGIQFDAQKFNWIGSPAAEISVVISWGTKPFKTVDDLRQREMVVSATGTGADSVVFPYILNGVLGTKMKVVTGYPGSAELLLAVERGEVDGNGGTSWGNVSTNRPDWLRDKKLNVILQLGTRKHPELNDVPFVMDYAKNEIDKGILELIFSRQTMAYPFAAPPDVPAERVQELRRAFDSVMADPAYLEDAKRHSLDVDPASGAEIETLVRRVYSSPAEVLARAKAALEEGKKNTRSK